MKQMMVVLFACCALFFSVPVSASSDTGEIQFVNNTSMYVRFYVDDVPSGACPPGEYAVTVAKVGRHTLKAVGPDDQYVTRDIDLTDEGFQWTISEQ